MTRLRHRLLPSPGLSAALFLAWLMLNGSLAPGHLLLGALLALALPLVTASRQARPVRVRAWGTAARLLLTVLWDIVVCNIEVARRVLGPEAALQPAFVWVPLDLRSPQGLVLLAGIVTLTPGTVSSGFSDDRRHLLVHALHCPDPAALVAGIKARYEAPLQEILA